MHAFARVTAYRLGLLDPSETQEVREHLRACEECRAAFEPFRELSEEEEGRPGHVPIALLTRWDAFAPLMTEDERTCLEAHFEDCPRCMEGRAFARLVPELPELHPAPSRQAWLGFGTAAMAAVLVVAVVVLTRERPAPTLSTPTSPPVATPVPAPAASVVRAPAVSLSGVDRGGEARVVRVPKGATVLPIRVPPLLGVGPDAPVEIRVEGPGGVAFGHAELVHRHLFGTSPDPVLDAHAPEGPLPEGHYRVHVSSDAESAEYGFDLRER